VTKEENPKQYDLEARTFAFAQRVRAFVRTLRRTICNIEDGRQLVKASGSVGANYIEANETLSKKDFRMRVRISRKEVRESRYWLRLLDTSVVDGQEQERQWLIGEATELARIFSSILQKSE
jgi:four helix bundle protein